MNKIDKSISITCKSIDDNINVFNNDRGLLSQNILSQLRNLVEDIAIKVFSNGTDLDPKDYNGVRVKAINFIKSNNLPLYLSNRLFIYTLL